MSCQCCPHRESRPPSHRPSAPVSSALPLSAAPQRPLPRQRVQSPVVGVVVGGVMHAFPFGREVRYIFCIRFDCPYGVQSFAMDGNFCMSRYKDLPSPVYVESKPILHIALSHTAHQVYIHNTTTIPASQLQRALQPQLLLTLPPPCFTSHHHTPASSAQTHPGKRVQFPPR